MTDGRGTHWWGHVKGFGAAWVQAQRVRHRLARGFGPDAMMSRKPRPFQELARIVWTASEGGHASSIALRAAREAAANPYALREMMAVFAFTTMGNVFSKRLDSVAPCPTPSPVIAFLFEPAEDGVPRVIAYLDAPEPLPGPVNGGHGEMAKWLVHAAMAEDDTHPGEDFGPLCDLLARTDQPDILDALHSAFSQGVGDAAYYAARPGEAPRPRPYRLWTGTSPALLTRVVSANRHLLRLPPPPEGEPPSYVQAPQVLLALLQGRPDLVGPIMRVRGPHGVVKSLRDGFSIEAPPEFMQACRQALRRLEDPAARDDVCQSALYGDEEMRAAAVDAGYVPSDLDKVSSFLARNPGPF